MSSKKTAPYLLLLPALLFLIVFLVYPMIHTIFFSFWNFSFFKPAQTSFAGFSNFVKLFSQKGFLSSLSFTLRFTFVCIALEFFIGLGLALLLRNIRRGGTVIRVMASFADGI